MNYLAVFLCVLLVAGCNNASDQSPVVSFETGDSGVYYSYSPEYTSGYTIGDFGQVKTVTEIWKHYENGDLMLAAPQFADNLTIVFPDHTISGAKDSVLAQLKAEREAFIAVQCSISSWLPVRTKEKKDEWVFLWGKQIRSDKNGGTRSIEVHEIWQFDKQGKVQFMQQYHTRVM
ncbi:MAG TPA: hypothetical protein VFR58_18395 [Flavisolibacter sp.]|nr:hypothetical protein [Flavisolibacter sp.]